MIALITAPLALTIRTREVVRSDLDRFFGLDLNYIRDRDSNRPTALPLDSALKELSARWLRYPGGEKSNYCFWSTPPYQKPNPVSFGWYATVKGDRMDFDEFIRHCRAAKAEPYVVVGYLPNGMAGVSLDRWIENAATWVRYSRARNYKVRYWEIGNENWNKGAAPKEVARDVVRLARAMKAVDPSIRVGASGDNERWWNAFLPIAGEDIDFLSVSSYPGWEWRSFDRLRARPNLSESADIAIAAIDRCLPSQTRSRFKVLAAEANTKDWSKGGWPDGNDLGHALVTFDLLGELASRSKVKAAMVWTSRWMNDLEAPRVQFYALDKRNHLTATGEALRAWTRFIEPDLLAVDGGEDPTVRAFAARSSSGRHLTIWVQNIANGPREIDLYLDDPSYKVARGERLLGSGESDTAPKWEPVAGLKPEIELPALSITALTFEKP